MLLPQDMLLCSKVLRLYNLQPTRSLTHITSTFAIAPTSPNALPGQKGGAGPDRSRGGGILEFHTPGAGMSGSQNCQTEAVPLVGMDGGPNPNSEQDILKQGLRDQPGSHSLGSNSTAAAAAAVFTAGAAAPHLDGHRQSLHLAIRLHHSLQLDFGASTQALTLSHGIHLGHATLPHSEPRKASRFPMHMPSSPLPQTCICHNVTRACPSKPTNCPDRASTAHWIKG